MKGKLPPTVRMRFLSLCMNSKNIHGIFLEISRRIFRWSAYFTACCSYRCFSSFGDFLHANDILSELRLGRSDKFCKRGYIHVAT